MSDAGAYAAPAAARATRPATILWYRVYAVSAALVYAFLAVAVAFVSSDSALAAAACALPPIAFYGVAAAVPYKPWGWTYALVAIALGLPTILAPAAIVLIVFWNRPLVKAAFARL